MAAEKKITHKSTVEEDGAGKVDQIAEDSPGATDSMSNCMEAEDREDEDNEGVAENTDEDEDEDTEDDPLLKFQNVMDTVNLEKVRQYAIDCRLQQPLPDNFDRIRLTCEVIEPPLHGSFNLVYVLAFSDKVQWVARFPIQGTRVKEADVDKMTTDYSTMQYLRRAFDVPMPEIYTWETTCDRVGVPFAFMSFVHGVSIDDRWNNKEWITEEKKLLILGNLARVMAKLQKPKFDKIGTLRFDEQGSFSHIGADHTVIEDMETFYTDGTVDVQCVGPYQSLEEWLAVEDTYEDVVPTARWGIGCLEIMRIALESVPSYLRRPGQCELDFYDFNYQNILIDDECNTTAIFDWDGVRSVAQGVGCTRYPSWITRDWDPASYGRPADGDWEASGEDSPEQLSRYRKHYADTFASLGLEDYDPRQTRLSHILEAVVLGMGERILRQYIMIVLLDHAYGKDKWPWKYQVITSTLKDPTTPAAKVMRKKILKQFQTMWHAEWETPEPEPIQKKKRISQGRNLLRRRAPKPIATTEELNVDKKAKTSTGFGRSIFQYLSSKLALLKR